MLQFFENLVNPFPKLDKGHPQAQVPPRTFWGFISYSLYGMRWPFVLLMLLTAVTSVLEALLFGFLGRIVDWLSSIAPAELWQREGKTLLLLGLATACIPLLTLAHATVQHQILAGNVPMRLRWIYHHLMLRQSMGFYQDEFSGRVSAKVMQTALAVRDMCNILGEIMVFVVVYFVTLIAMVGQFNLMMLIPFGIWLVLYVGALSFFIPRLARISQQQADARSLMTGRITDAYSNIHTVKLFSHAGREAHYAQEAMQSFMVTVHGQMRLVTGTITTNTALTMGLIGGTTALAIWLWSRGQITIGAVAAASAMTLRLNGMAHWIMWESTRLFEQIGTVRDGLNMLSRENKVLDAPDAKPLVVSRGEVVFENVFFAYDAKHPQELSATGAQTPLAVAPEDQKWAIQGLNLRLRPGEKLGLVGPSGAGKTTLTSLLLRFYDLQKGSIRIDGQDIRHVTQDSLRRAIGMVTQDTALLHRTIRENILYGRPEASESEMVEAARKAQADSFIRTLVDAKGQAGYDAQVGERGIKLSGGQRQRIAIARVMLKNAPILLLDEATSALDSEVEAAIQESLYQLMEGKTVIAIAHRLSTIAAMDRLIVLNQGRIVEEGTHTQLIEQGGLYARLWKHQSGGFLGVNA